MNAPKLHRHPGWITLLVAALLGLGLLATPVAAHNIFAPTVLFGRDAALEVRSRSDRQMRLNVDGREAAVLEPEAVVRVRRGSRAARFIVPWPRPFTDVVREKFRLAEEEGRA